MRLEQSPPHGGFPGGFSRGFASALRTAMGLRHIVVPTFVLLIGLLFSLAVAMQLWRVAEAEDRERFQHGIERKLDGIQDRLETYVAVLRGAAGLFTASDDVDRNGFATYVDRLQLLERYPGVQGIGFSRRVPADRRDELTAAMQRQGIAGFEIWPHDPRSEYHAILYLEPLDRRNQSAIGYDMFTDPVRRAAMERARDSGLPSASGRVELVQEIDDRKQPGFLIYLPVYETGKVPDEVAERRATLLGFVYSPFRAHDLFDAIFTEERNPELRFQVYDGDIAPENLLYRSDSDRPAGAGADAPRFTGMLPVEVAGRRWTIFFATRPEFELRSSRGMVPFFFAGGALVTVLLAGATWLQARAARTAELAKDALHQINDTLEQRVKERTHALEQTQADLRAVNENLELIVAARTGELRDANEEIQRFAYVISHDLRAPLVNIMGFTSELEAVRAAVAERLAAQEPVPASSNGGPNGGDGPSGGQPSIDEEFAEALGFIKASTAKMDRLISAILKLSREGRRKFAPERLDMEELVASIADTLQHQLQERGAEIEIGAMPSLVSDRLAIEQVFTNLLENAVKYLDDRRPGRILVRGSEQPATLRYEIKDNGRGIDPKDHERIFDLFRRAGAQDRPGEGIGLPHVRTLVRRLGGTITCESELGRGSIFAITLPRNAFAARNAT
ncbi:CHASE domain-containing protein [Rhodospirillaceae bacterium SYSU D60014]|uniref:CHASE domain-containing protein n=1 Tax=Virgifigura deserti TaxID=2268457 RepID=UPI000E673006